MHCGAAYAATQCHYYPLIALPPLICDPLDDMTSVGLGSIRHAAGWYSTMVRLHINTSSSTVGSWDVVIMSLSSQHWRL